MNIQFSYCYRDYGNNKRFNSIIFSNPLNRTGAEVNSLIKKHLIEGELFYTKDWNLPDTRFDDWDEELDHNLHEFEKVEETTIEPDSDFDLENLLKVISQTKNNWH